MDVKLDPRDQEELEDLAKAAGKDPAQILRELVHEALCERKRNGAQAPSGEESCFEAAFRAGLIGCIKGGPTDMSTNPKYMEGFGEH